MEDCSRCFYQFVDYFSLFPPLTNFKPLCPSVSGGDHRCHDSGSAVVPVCVLQPVLLSAAATAADYSRTDQAGSAPLPSEHLLHPDTELHGYELGKLTFSNPSLFKTFLILHSCP